MPKLLLMGSQNVGKTTMHSIIFGQLPLEKGKLPKTPYTIGKEKYVHDYIADFRFSFWDCGGQESFMK